MTQTNLVSFNVPDADLAEIKKCIASLQEKLLPHLKTLSPEERQDMLKMGDKTVGFVRKTVDYCRQNPELVPPFLDINELAVDLQALETIRSIYQPLLQLAESLSDTMALSGSEAFSGSLMFYSSVKNAMYSKVPKAETIYNDLSARFPGKPRKEKPPAAEDQVPTPQT